MVKFLFGALLQLSATGNSGVLLELNSLRIWSEHNFTTSRG
jgi:hypothetical protein